MPTQMSHGGDSVPTPMSHDGNMPGTSAWAAGKPGPPSSRWVSIRGHPTCAEPDAGSRTAPPSLMGNNVKIGLLLHILTCYYIF